MKFTVLTTYTLLMLLMSCNYLADKRIKHHFSETKDTFLINSYAFFKEHTPNEFTHLCKDHRFLIDDITLAVSSCRESLESKEIPFDIFCEYVLALRVYNEPVEDWRKECVSTFAYLKGKRPEYICDRINYHFMENFNYGDRYSEIAKPWSVLKQMQFGDCYDMAQAPIFPLRALGIPTTIDFTYGWGNANGIHIWNVAYINGRMQPFMGIEEGPDTFNPLLLYNYGPDSTLNCYRHAAKIYRKTPITNKEILDLRKHINKEDTPPILSDYKVKDVSSEYFPVKDVSIPNTLQENKQDKVAYLAIYNNNQWQPAVATVIGNSDSLTFKSIKANMLYMPSLYKNKETISYNAPFILTEDGKVRELIPDNTKQDSFVVDFLNPILFDYLYLFSNRNTMPANAFLDMSKNNKHRKLPENGEEYTLLYWNNKWKEITKNIANNSKIIFTEIPSNALFQLADQNGELIGRCFTVENNKMIWW